MQRARNGRTAESRYSPAPGQGRAKQRAFVTGIMPDSDDLSELKELLRTAGVATVGELVQHRERPHPNLYLGPGKVEELKALAKAADANVVAVDDELTPRQERNLEKELDMPVVDRTATILDIFAGHAHTAEGKLQVELAQLGEVVALLQGADAERALLGTAGAGTGRAVGGLRRAAVATLLLHPSECRGRVG